MESINSLPFGSSLSTAKGIGPRLPGLISLFCSSLFLVPLLHSPVNVDMVTGHGLTVDGVMDQPQEVKIHILPPILTLSSSPPISPTPIVAASDPLISPRWAERTCFMLVLTGIAIGAGLITVMKGGGRGDPPPSRRPIGLYASQKRKKGLHKKPRKPVGKGGGDPPDEDPPPPPPPGPGSNDADKSVRPPDHPDPRHFMISFIMYLAIMTALSRMFPQESAQMASYLRRVFRDPRFDPNDRKFQRRLRRTLVGWFGMARVPLMAPPIQDSAVTHAIMMEQRWSQQDQYIFFATLALASLGFRPQANATNVANTNLAVVEWTIADEITEICTDNGDMTMREIETENIFRGLYPAICAEAPQELEITAPCCDVDILAGETSKENLPGVDEALCDLLEISSTEVEVVEIWSDGERTRMGVEVEIGAESDVESEVDGESGDCADLEIESVVLEGLVGSVDEGLDEALAFMLETPEGEEKSLTNDEIEEKASLVSKWTNTPGQLDVRSTAVLEDARIALEVPSLVPSDALPIPTLPPSSESGLAEERDSETENPDEIRERKVNAEGERPQMAPEEVFPALVESCTPAFELLAVAPDACTAETDREEKVTHALTEDGDFTDAELRFSPTDDPVASTSRLPAVSTPPPTIQGDALQTVERKDAYSNSGLEGLINTPIKSKEESHDPHRIQAMTTGKKDTVTGDNAFYKPENISLLQDRQGPLEIENLLITSTPIPLRKFNPSVPPFFPSAERTLQKSLRSLPFWAPNTRPAPVLRPPTAEENRAAKLARRAARRAAASFIIEETSGSRAGIDTFVNRTDLDHSWLSDSTFIIGTAKRSSIQDSLGPTKTKHLVCPIGSCSFHSLITYILISASPFDPCAPSQVQYVGSSIPAFYKANSEAPFTKVLAFLGSQHGPTTYP
ncbi:hypothetical protein BDZ94DRAFT_895877 [Collybia nuda]|uniref:Uncharacterized protein n=1 Tax=Collybia nuda TaxID=64659 RepID=A0A9P5Y328_9AGAR|nr:hypothetical protein BDZ94DRAFT_895877 [Collybia nuda]